MEGGEQNFAQYVWTNKGAIYDPTHECVDVDETRPSGWSSIGDAQSAVLSNGTFMVANCCSAQAALLNATTLDVDPLPVPVSSTRTTREGWTLLPGGEGADGRCLR